MVDPSNSNSVHNKLLLLRTRPLDEWPLRTLIEMSGDDDPGVRDWATFAIAARDDDDEFVRQTLLQKSCDPDFDTRSEAIWGLARRRDQRALPLLLEALQGEEVGALLVEAAGYFGRPELVQPLKQLQQWWNVDEALLAQALASCRGDLESYWRFWDLVPANDDNA